MDQLLCHREPPREPEWWARVETLDEQMDEAALRAKVFTELSIYAANIDRPDLRDEYAAMSEAEWDRYRRLRDERDDIEGGFV